MAGIQFYIELVNSEPIVWRRILVGKAFTYIYDFGDHWEHAITRESVINDDIIRPFCLEGSGACPPEDCGGMGGYAEMLQAINIPGHPERESYIEWLGLQPGETANRLENLRI